MVPEEVTKKPDASRELLGQPLTQGKVTTSCHSKSCPPVRLPGVSHTTGCLHWLSNQVPSLPPFTVPDSSCVWQRFCKHVAELETKKQHLSKKKKKQRKRSIIITTQPAKYLVVGDNVDFPVWPSSRCHTPPNQLPTVLLCRDPENRKRGHIPPALMCTSSIPPASLFMNHTYLSALAFPWPRPHVKPNVLSKRCRCLILHKGKLRLGEGITVTTGTASTQQHQQCRGDFSFWKPSVVPPPQTQSSDGDLRNLSSALTLSHKRVFTSN